MLKRISSCLFVAVMLIMAGDTVSALEKQKLTVEQIVVYDVINGVLEESPEIYSKAEIQAGIPPITSSQTVKITAKISEGNSGVADKNITLLSSVAGQPLWQQNTVQYLRQLKTDDDGTAVFTFTPGTLNKKRVLGKYNVTLSSSNISENAVLTLSVNKADISLEKVNGVSHVGFYEELKYKINGLTGECVNPSLCINQISIDENQFEITKSGENHYLIICAQALEGLEVGKHTITFSADSCTEATESFLIEDAANLKREGLGFENSTKYVMQNESKTIGLYSPENRFDVYTEGDGNRACSVKAHSSTSSLSKNGDIYFDIPKNYDSYRVGMNFKFIEGEQVLIKAVPDDNTKLGEIRINSDGSISTGGNWADITSSGTYALNQWHLIEVWYNGAKGFWYLDGQRIGEFDINTTDKLKTLEVWSKANASSTNSVMLLDNIEYSQIDGNFEAVASLNNGLLNIDFSEMPKDFDPTSITTLIDTNGNNIEATYISQKGKSYYYNLSSSPANGKKYQITLPDNLKSSFESANLSRQLVLNTLPNVSDLTIISSETGGIYTDIKDAQFKIKAKNSGATTEDIFMDAFVSAEDGTKLWRSESLSFGEVQSGKFSNELIIKPYWDNSEYTYGRFWLNILIKNASAESYITQRYPFSVVYSTGILNPKLGVNTHYSTHDFGTEVQSVASEFELNKIAGFGAVRESYAWANYETSPGEYSFESKVMPKKIFDLAKENSMTLDMNLVNRIWRNNIGAGTDSFMEMPITQSELEKYENYLKAYTAYVKEMNGSVIYEISNEWDLNMWNKTLSTVSTEEPLTIVKHYLAMVRTAYQTIKAEDPSAKVVGITASLSNKMLEFIKECAESGVINYCDAIAIHPYSDPMYMSPEEYSTVLKLDANGKATGEPVNGIQELLIEIKNILTQAGKPDMPIILTEWGWTSTPGLVSEEEQAQYIVRGAALVCDEVESTMLYTGQNKKRSESILERNFGLVEANSSQGNYSGQFPVIEEPTAPLSAKLAYIAVSLYNSLVGDTEPLQLIKDQNKNYLRGYANKQKIVIQLWNSDGNGNVFVDVRDFGVSDMILAKSATLYDMYGNAKAVTSTDGVFGLETEEKVQYLVIDLEVNVVKNELRVNNDKVKSLAEIENGSRVDFSVSVRNNKVDREVYAYIVGYNKEGSVVAVDVKSALVAKDGMVHELPVASITKTAEIAEIKTFVWDESLLPFIVKIKNLK